MTVRELIAALMLIEDDTLQVFVYGSFDCGHAVGVEHVKARYSNSRDEVWITNEYDKREHNHVPDAV